MGKYLRLLISLLIPLTAGYLGSVFTSVSINSGWYDSLQKSSINPPSFIFAPVWTLLYLLMGFSFFIVWDKCKGRKFKMAKAIYSMQLVLNFLWSFVFFGLRSPLLGLVVIIFLLMSITANISVFYKIDKRSAYLLFPYLLWVSFATVLNLLIFSMNN